MTQSSPSKDELIRLSAIALARLIKQGKISSFIAAKKVNKSG